MCYQIYHIGNHTTDRQNYGILSIHYDLVSFGCLVVIHTRLHLESESATLLGNFRVCGH